MERVTRKVSNGKKRTNQIGCLRTSDLDQREERREREGVRVREGRMVGGI
jgi:hypothetical protein